MATSPVVELLARMRMLGVVGVGVGISEEEVKEEAEGVPIDRECGASPRRSTRPQRSGHTQWIVPATSAWSGNPAHTHIQLKTTPLLSLPSFFCSPICPGFWRHWHCIAFDEFCRYI